MADRWSKWLTSLGIRYRSELQWALWRDLVFHLPAGLAIGASAYGCSQILGPMFYLVTGGVLIAVLLWKELRDQDQSLFKKLTDIPCWLIGFFSAYLILG